MENLLINVFEPDDFPQWLPLWDGNNLGHRDKEVTAETWSRLNDPASTMYGLAARLDNQMAGLLHYILHPVTGHIQPVCYMQDVYVDPDFRCRGIGRSMIEYLAALGKKEGWARLYWLAENDNMEAQNLYKNLGIKLNFSLHVMPL